MCIVWNGTVACRVESKPADGEPESKAWCECGLDLDLGSMGVCGRETPF